MTTWTMEQVRQVERLRAALVVSDEVLQRESTPDLVKQFSEGKMAGALTKMAHPFGVELHRDDFEVEWIRDEMNPWQVTGRVRWHPKTNTVELRGGHLDGQRYAVRKVGEPLEIPRLAETPWLMGDDESAATAAVTTMRDRYELIGWREDERVWVYEAR